MSQERQNNRPNVAIAEAYRKTEIFVVESLLITTILYHC